MKITKLWLGQEVLEDGSFSHVLDSYLALQHANWMILTDKDGSPRATEPGDIFWGPILVSGVEICLSDGWLVATDGTTEVRLQDVDPSSVFATGDPSIAALLGMLQPPFEEPEAEIPTGRFDTGLSGSFGQRGAAMTSEFRSKSRR